jgi:hypothetical protein
LGSRETYINVVERKVFLGKESWRANQLSHMRMSLIPFATSARIAGAPAAPYTDYEEEV